MTQYVVVVRPDATSEVKVIGPFRSLEKAIAVQERIEKLEERLEPWASWAPTVERTDKASEVIRTLREDNSQ